MIAHRLALATVVLLLAGCAGAAAAPSLSAPVPTATTTVAPEPVAKPGSRVPGTCADLLDPSSINALMGEGVLTQDVDFVATQPYLAVEQQVGAATCVWSTHVGTGYATLALSALADGALEFQRQGGEVVDATPDAASCYDHSSGYFFCDFTFVSDSYWVSGIFETNGLGLLFDDVSNRLATTLQAVDTALSDMGQPLPAWTPPYALAGPSTCETLDPTNAAATAMSDDVTGPVFTEDVGSPEDVNQLLTYTHKLSGRVTCSWTTSNSSAAFTVLPGSEWAWDRLDRSSWTPVSISGAAEAYRSETGGLVSFDLLVNGSWMQATTNPGAENEARLIRGIEAILPGIPIVAS